MLNGIKNKILFVICVTIFLRLVLNVSIMSYFGDRLIVNETSKSVKSIGENVVSVIESRIISFESIGNAIGVIYPEIEAGGESGLKSVLPLLIDNSHDMRISGGGVWGLDNQEKSLYWKRGTKAQMQPVDVSSEASKQYYLKECKPFMHSLPKDTFFWNTLHASDSDGPIVATAIRKLFDKAGRFTSTLSLDVRLEGLRSNIEYWERRLGAGYIFVVDQSNQFVTFPEAVKSLGSNMRMNASALASQNEDFNDVYEKLVDMDGSLLRRAMEMPSFSPDLPKHLLYDNPDLSKGYVDAVSSILMNPIVNEAFYKKFSIDNDFLLNESAKAYTYFVPKTYWKLVLVVPDSYEGASMAKLSKIFHAIWILAILFSFGAASWIISKVVMKPLRESSQHIEETIDAFKNEDWSKLEKIRKESKGDDEIKSLVEVFNVFIEKILTYNESVEFDQKESDSDRSKSLKEKDKILDRFHEIEIENKELKEMLKSDMPLIDKKEKEYSSSMKEHQQELLNVMKSVKGLRVSVLNIWEGVLLIPDVTPLIAEDSNEEFERMLSDIKASNSDSVIISLEGLLLEHSSDLVELISRLNQAVSLIGKDVLFVDIPVAIAAELARNNKGGSLSSFSSISQSLFAVWEKRDNDIKNRPTA